MSQLFMRRPDLAGLPPLDPPFGYRLRTLRRDDPADVEAVAAVLQGAFPEMTWDADRLRAALVADTTVRESYVIDDPAGRPAATASVRLLPDAHPGSGYLHWVAVRPDQRGRRLGRLASLAVLHAFVRLGSRDAVLQTDDERLPAIKTYLGLGFVPENREETHGARWEAVRARLPGGGG